MSKMKFESPDLTAQNIDRIAALFPNCVTEMLDEERSTKEKKVYKRAINFELLKQMLSPAWWTKAYEFTWVGKKAAIVEANKPIRKTLRPCVEESKNWDSTENLYIEGDNLEVLKLLQESYLGKVKMIYIDPPYNTGNDFIYADDFMRSQEEENEQMGMFDEDENRLFKNTDTNGRFHSDWCSMIYSRLMLARNLLTEDGVIFISIDDNEQDNLKKICDEILGASNFLACLIWEKTRKNDARFFSTGHEYMIVYAKSAAYLVTNNLYFREDKPGAAEIYAEYLKLQQQYGADYVKMQDELQKYYIALPKEHPAKKLSRYNKIDENGIWRDDNMSWPGGKGPTYDVIHPVTGKPCAVPPGGWRYASPEKMQEMIKAGKVVFREDETLPPIKKTYLVRKPGKRADSEDENIGKQVMGTYFYRSYLQSSIIMEEMLGKGIFEYSKDHEIIKRMVSYVTKQDSIVLDFFSGSATTAHAVMQLNAEDGGHRKFIMVQLPEKCDETSEAKAGYKNICEIGKERIRRAGEKIKAESPTTTQDLDIGFRVLKLDDTNMKDVYYAADDYSQDMIAGLESNIKDDRTDLDLLFGCLIDWGLPLSLPYRSEQMDGCTVHTYNGGDLIACFDANIPESVVKTIAKRKPLRAVFRDSGFASSPEKINVFEIFKLYMPEDAGDITKRVRVI
ncbi:MAG: site-specific DNA-methyltransferase [Christensenellales bacterium]